MRTIAAPGVEIREIDKSQYSPSMTGTAALVMGFANKGEDYNTMQFTSRSSWLNYYGEPDNEAERYFYNACMEVINQNGILYSAKIPYENEARDKYVTKKYTVSIKTSPIGSVAEYLANATSSNAQLSTLFEGDFTAFGYGIEDLPALSGIKDENVLVDLSGYAMTVKSLSGYYETLNEYNIQRNATGIAFPLFYRYTSTDADDNWVYYNQQNIAERLYNLFNLSSDFWVNFSNRYSKTTETKTGTDVEEATDNLTATTASDETSSYITVKDFIASGTILSGLEFLIQSENINTESNKVARYNKTSILKSFDNQADKDALSVISMYEPLDYVKAFIKGYEETFGTIATAYEAYNFRASKLTTSTPDMNDPFISFIVNAKDVLEAINNYVFETEVESEDESGYELYSKEYDVEKTDNAYPSSKAPYIYTTEKYYNLPSYYSAAKYAYDTEIIDSEVISGIFSNLNYLMSEHISGNGDGTVNIVVNGETLTADITSKDAAPYIKLDAEFGEVLPIANSYIKDPETMENDNLVTLIETIKSFITEEDGKYQAIRNSLTIGKLVTTQYIKDMLAFYGEQVNISDYYDNEAIYADNVTLDVLSSTYDIPDDLEIDEDYLYKYKTGKNFFEKYGAAADITGTKYEKKISLTFEDHLDILRTAFINSLTKTKLINYINLIRAQDEFQEIERYIANSPTTKTLNKYFSQAQVEADLEYAEVREVDDSIREYFTIRSNNLVYTTTRDQIDEYRTGESKVAPNTIVITDLTRSQYDRTVDATETECVGIIPIITTAANAMVAQSLITDLLSGTSYGSYQPVRKLATLSASFKEKNVKHEHKEFILGGEETDSKSNIVTLDELSTFTSKMIYSESDEDETLGDEAANSFTTLQYTDSGEIARDNLYDIGVVVFKAFIDASEGNKISFQAVEAFCGSLDSTAVDPNTGATKFIDTLVNEHSEYINLFSNCYASTATRKKYDEDVDILIVEPQKAGVLGFYEDMMVEEISLSKSIYDGLEKVFDKNQDINEKDIDIVCDAGISNIAQYIKTIYGTGKGSYDPTSTEASLFKLKNRNNTLTWRAVLQKYDNFCKNVRKDCMFIADGLRPLCLIGNKKIIRDTKPSNTIDANILPYVKYMAGINTNYGAGYCDWFLKADDFTGENFWCPPSVQAMGIYIYTDVNANYFDAPAGLNRGIVTALDVAFSPTNKQAGTIYNQNWNYAINYPRDGIVLEGQKTFQVKPTAFDRVNVRRLFLRLERAAYNVARYFVYEGNTAYTRQRLIDTLDPIFSTCMTQGGIYDYKIICDESINTADVIDNNELRVKIGIKPVKTAEFILIDFIALSTGGSFSEM